MRTTRKKNRDSVGSLPAQGVGGLIVCPGAGMVGYLGQALSPALPPPALACVASGRQTEARTVRRTSGRSGGLWRRLAGAGVGLSLGELRGGARGLARLRGGVVLARGTRAAAIGEAWAKAWARGDGAEMAAA